MPRGRGRVWGFSKRWKRGDSAGVAPAPPSPIPAVIVTITPSWYHTAPTAGSSVRILPALQSTPWLPPDPSVPQSPPPDPSAPPGPSAPEQPPTQQPTPPSPPPSVKPLDFKALDVKPLDTLSVSSGRASRLSTITVVAPVRCVCAFVTDRICRHSADCRRKRCDFAAAKTVGYCGLPTLLLAWGVFWVLLLLGLGGMLTAPALTDT